MSRLNKNLQSKKKKKKKKAYVHVHPVPVNKKTQLLGFTKFIPYIPPSFPHVLQVLCRNKAHGR